VLNPLIIDLHSIRLESEVRKTYTLLKNNNLCVYSFSESSIPIQMCIENIMTRD